MRLERKRVKRLARDRTSVRKPRAGNRNPSSPGASPEIELITDNGIAIITDDGLYIEVV